MKYVFTNSHCDLYIREVLWEFLLQTAILNLFDIGGRGVLSKNRDY